MGNDTITTIIVIATAVVVVVLLGVVLPILIRRSRYAAVAQSELGRSLLAACSRFEARVARFPRLEWHYRENVSTLSAFSKDWERWLDRKMKDERDAIARAMQAQPERDTWDQWIAGVFAHVNQEARKGDERTRRVLRAIVEKARKGGGKLHGIVVPDAHLGYLYAEVFVKYDSPGGRAHREQVVSISGQRIAAVASVPQRANFADLHRSPIPQSLRVAVLRRDGYRCQMCGRSSKTDGVALEVDHIQPSSLGGPTVDWNLQTLCRDCNRGKSNNFEG